MCAHTNLEDVCSVFNDATIIGSGVLAQQATVVAVGVRGL